MIKWIRKKLMAWIAPHVYVVQDLTPFECGSLHGVFIDDQDAEDACDELGGDASIVFAQFKPNHLYRRGVWDDDNEPEPF